MMSDTQKVRETLYDIVSEEAFISHLISDPQLLVGAGDVAASLSGERKVLAKNIEELASANEPLTEESLRVHGAEEKIRQLFAKLAPLMPPVSGGKLIDRLRNVASRREIASAAASAFSGATEGVKSANAVIEDLEAATAKSRFLLQGHETSGGVSHVGEVEDLVEDIVWRTKNPGQIRGMEFGFPRLESYIDGLQAAKLYLIGARPSVGKTALAGDIVVNLCKRDIPCMFFSLEMSGLQVRQRVLATYCGVNPTKSLRGPLIKSELDDIRRGVSAMKGWPLWIDDTDRCSIEQIRSRARSAVAQHDVKCIVVDYIQLVRGVEPKSRNSKQEEVCEVSGALKALTKELAVPVVCLAQLRRTGNAYSSSSSQTEIPKPNLESLKESGSLEQDADAVILLHRDPAKNASEALAIVAKNRSGACGEVRLQFANDTTSFSEDSVQFARK